MKPVRSVARAMLSGIFVISGARAVLNPDPLAPRAKELTEALAALSESTAQGRTALIRADPRTLVRLNGVVQLVGGLLLATGHLTRPAATALAGSMIPTTLAGHPFWNYDEPAQRTNQQIHFLKNLGLMGGLLLAAADTGGRPGLRWRTSRVVADGRRSARRVVRAAKRDARTAVKSAGIARRLPG